MGDARGHSIQVQLDVDDYVVAQRLHTRWTKKRLLVSLCACIAGGLLALSEYEWLFVVGCGLIGGAVGGAVAFEITRKLQLPRRARRLFAQQKNLQRPATFSWDGEGLAWSNANGSGKTAWTDYVKWRQNERLFLLYHSDVMFQMLPKRAFQGAEQLQSFAAELEQITPA